MGPRSRKTRDQSSECEPWVALLEFTQIITKSHSRRRFKKSTRGALTFLGGGGEFMVAIVRDVVAPPAGTSSSGRGHSNGSRGRSQRHHVHQ